MKQVKQVEKGMIHPVMLYKHPGPHLMGKKYFDYTIVDKCNENAFDAALADGWCTTQGEAETGTVPVSQVEKEFKEKAEKAPEVKEVSTTEEQKAKDVVEKAKGLRAGKK